MEKKEVIADESQASKTNDKQSIFINNISHDDFRAGIKSRELKIIIANDIDDATDICTDKNKNILNIIGLTGFTPIIFSIVYSIVMRNYWYLFGIAICWLTYGILRSFGQTPISLLLLINIGYWIKSGFHFRDYFTFFSLVFMMTGVLWLIEREYHKMLATDSLVEDSHLFYKALAAKKFMILRIK